MPCRPSRPPQNASRRRTTRTGWSRSCGGCWRVRPAEARLTGHGIRVMVGSFDAVATHSVPRPEPVRWRAGDFWLAAVWFGWMAGLLESSIVAVRQSWLGDLMSDGLERVFSPHVLWMAPLADLCL